MFTGLAKTDPRIDDLMTDRYTKSSGRRAGCPQGSGHLTQKVAVRGLPLVVHDDNWYTMLRCQPEHRLGIECPVHIVDQIRPGLERCPRHGRLAGIDRDGHAHRGRHCSQRR